MENNAEDFLIDQIKIEQQMFVQNITVTDQSVYSAISGRGSFVDRPVGPFSIKIDITSSLNIDILSLKSYIEAYLNK